MSRNDSLGTCEQCGAATSKRHVKRCRACWRTRQHDLPPNERTVHLGKCGHPVTKVGVELCRDCWRAQRHITHLASTITDQSDVALIDALRTSRGLTLDALAQQLDRTPGQVLDAILALKGRGLNVHQIGDRWSLERHMPIEERAFTYQSRPDNTYVFGVASDQHLCSRYAREDVLADLYDAFVDAGVDRVFNAGNWIDGEDEKNRFDLQVHGFEPQIDYLVERYPRRDGITTYAVWGEDHEGWYSRREAIDVGRFAERRMRDAGREDWVDLGFVEARVDLVNANTGAKTTLVVMHPGGGSSYAYSYRSQKIVEALSGGEKPAVLLIGHYHKLNCNLIRNVWTAQCGTQQDQTVFMRKKGLDAHVGGAILMLQQDPETGAIFRCVWDQRSYFDRAYYNDRWSKTRPVVQAPRYMGGVTPVRRG